MGWTYTHKFPCVSATDYLKDLMNENLEILDSALVNSHEWYAACRDKRNGEVFALVYLVNNDNRAKDGFNFGYKGMDEFMGPCEDNCPERILNLLTETTSEYAIGWRQRCREKIEQRAKARTIKNGSVIRFSHPLKFTDGETLDTFIIRKQERKILFLATVDGVRKPYRISKWQTRPFSVVNMEGKSELTI